jgi:hypothetical protein
VLVETGVTIVLRMPVQQSESYAADRAIARNIVLGNDERINAIAEYGRRGLSSVSSTAYFDAP